LRRRQPAGGGEAPLTTEEIQQYVDTMITAAEHLTRSTGGQIPLTLEAPGTGAAQP
jgi:hypothetical protein